MSDRTKCEICGKICYGLMDFASHVAQTHGISAIKYWDLFGHEHDTEKERNRKINPSRRIQKYKIARRDSK